MTSMDRRAARHAEIERDHRLVALSLAAALRRIARETGPAGVDPERLWQRVEGALEQSRDAYRRLNNARINLRAQRSAQFDDSQPLPAALGCYRHRGNYRGVFRSMTALGVLLRRTRGMPGDGMHDGGAADIARACTCAANCGPSSTAVRCMCSRSPGAPAMRPWPGGPCPLPPRIATTPSQTMDPAACPRASATPRHPIPLRLAYPSPEIPA